MRWITLLLTVLALNSCTDADPAAVDDQATGPIIGYWDGIEWRGRGYAVLLGDTLHLWGHRRPDPAANYDEYIRVSVRVEGAGEYAVPFGSAEMWKIVGGDAGYMPRADGTLVLTEVEDRVQGSLDLQSEPQAGAAWTFAGASFDFPVYDDWGAVPCLGCID